MRVNLTQEDIDLLTKKEYIKLNNFLNVFLKLSDIKGVYEIPEERLKRIISKEPIFLKSKSFWGKPKNIGYGMALTFNFNDLKPNYGGTFGFNHFINILNKMNLKRYDSYFYEKGMYSEYGYFINNYALEIDILIPEELIIPFEKLGLLVE